MTTMSEYEREKSRIKVKLLISAAVTGVVAAGAAAAMTHAFDTQYSTVPEERCFGIAAARKNDCATVNNSCAATALKDRQWDAYISVPQGLCQKISGGVKGKI